MVARIGALVAVAGVAGPIGLAAGAASGIAADVLVVRGLRRASLPVVGAANAVTWLRSVLTGAAAALVVGGDPAGVRAAAAIAVVALVLDGVDGRIARATGTVSRFGARFDMEVDASTVLVLSVGAAATVGPWVLLVGAARYLLLAATALLPVLRGETPPRMWRKAVAVVQGVVLAAVCSGLLPAAAASSLAVAAALALAWSFATQVGGLVRARRVAPVREAIDARSP